MGLAMFGHTPLFPLHHAAAAAADDDDNDTSPLAIETSRGTCEVGSHGAMMAGSSESEYYSEEEVGWEEEGLGSKGVEEKREWALKRLDGLGKRGVCYLSRVPPNMNPSHVRLRRLLSKHGEV
uniref:Uncharacterized protein n=1 Tax=Oryza rufipogon TaxID=4529 RepID=A0A0E0PH17_ORYRU